MLHLILIPLITVILSQIIKLIIDARKGKFSWHDLNSYGGLPSSHTAFVTAVTVCAAYFEDWDSAAFAISLVFAILIIRDATGFRRQIGKQAEIINYLSRQLPASQSIKIPHLIERIGHRPLEILAGITIGIIIPAIYILLFI